MSFKKLAVVAAGVTAIALTANVVAGGPEEQYTTPSYAGVYVELNAGYAYRPWVNNVTNDFGAANLLGGLTGVSNGNGGFTGGADLGYQFNQFLAIEGGWYYLPQVSGTFAASLLGASAPSVNVSSGVAYAALKGNAPIANNTYLFGKIGAAYTYNSASNPGLVRTDVSGLTTNSNYWNPMFATGIQYYFTPSWSVNVQYAYIPGFEVSSSNRFIAPESQLITAGFGYKFLM